MTHRPAPSDDGLCPAGYERTCPPGSCKVPAHITCTCITPLRPLTQREAAVLLFNRVSLLRRLIQLDAPLRIIEDQRRLVGSAFDRFPLGHSEIMEACDASGVARPRHEVAALEAVKSIDLVIGDLKIAKANWNLACNQLASLRAALKPFADAWRVADEAGELGMWPDKSEVARCKAAYDAMQETGGIDAQTSRGRNAGIP